MPLAVSIDTAGMGTVMESACSALLLRGRLASSLLSHLPGREPRAGLVVLDAIVGQWKSSGQCRCSWATSVLKHRRQPRRNRRIPGIPAEHVDGWGANVGCVDTESRA